jgi:hypothetical protein
MKHAGLLTALLAVLCCFVTPEPTASQRGGGGPGTAYLLRPDRVFDGEAMQQGWAVLVRGQRIEAAGPRSNVTAPGGAETIDMPGVTLMPGLIERIHTSFCTRITRRPGTIRCFASRKRFVSRAR